MSNGNGSQRTKMILRRQLLLNTASLAGALWSLPLWAQVKPEVVTPNAPPSLSVFSAIPIVKSISMSPDGRAVAILTVKNDITNIIHYDLNLKTRKIFLVPSSITNSNIRNLLFVGPGIIAIVYTESSIDDKFLGGLKTFEYVEFINIVTEKLIEFNNSQMIPERDCKVNVINKSNCKYITTAFRIFDEIKIFKRGDKYFAAIVVLQSMMALNSTIVPTKNLLLLDFASKKSIEMDFTEWKTADWVLDSAGYPIARSTYGGAFGFANKVWNLEFLIEKKWKSVLIIEEDIDPPSLIGMSRDGNGVLVRFNAGKLDNHYVAISNNGTISAPIPEGETASQAFFSPFKQKTCGLHL